MGVQMLEEEELTELPDVGAGDRAQVPYMSSV